MLAILIIPALLVVAALVLIVSLRVLRPDVQHERIRTVANIVSAGAAVTIPIVVYQAAERARISDVTTAKDTRTLQMMIDADHRLSTLVDRKAELDRDANAGPDRRFTYKYIDGSADVRTLVRDILNEYEAVCVGVNQGLLSVPVVWAMRGDALLATFSDYAPYIKEHRAAKPQTNATAWTDCDDLAKAMRGRRDKLNAQANESKKRQVDLLP